MAAIHLVTTKSPAAPFSENDLIREANHRIANHLSLIVGMVQIQASALAKGPDQLSRQDVHSILQETAGKILGVSHLHRKMADAPRVSSVDLAGFLVDGCKSLVQSLGLNERVGIAYEFTGKCLVPAEKAQPLSLIANEIVMNAVKHAHPTDLPVLIHITCGSDGDGRTYMEIMDDGVGLPENFDEKKGGGVGFKLIRGLVSQLGATLRIESSDLGLLFRVTLPA